MPPVHTAFFAALSLLMLLALGLRTSLLRMKHQVFAGDGGIPELQRASRAHGVAFEHLVPALLALLCLELIGTRAWIVDALGATLLLSRLVHSAVRLRWLGSRWGAASMGANYALEALLGVLLLVKAVTRLA